jgi:hypothetical protein
LAHLSALTALELRLDAANQGNARSNTGLVAHLTKRLEVAVLRHGLELNHSDLATAGAQLSQ